MKNKKTLFIVCLVLLLLLIGASALYDRLSRVVDSNQLMVQDSAAQGTDAETSATDGTDPTDDVETRDTASTTAPTDEPHQVMAPDFTVYDIDGNEVHLSDYLGKPVVVNFWASWCGPCKMEMPDFDEACTRLDGEVQFLMINMTDGYQETVETASAFIAEQGYTFPVFYDTASNAAMVYGATSLPTTFFIDAEGHAIAQAVGAIDGETLQKGIDMIMP